MGMKDSSVFLAVLFVPALLFVVLSGRLTEVKAPGGWSAQFVSVTMSPVQSQTERIRLTEAIEIRKASPDMLEDRLSELDQTRPIILALDLGGHPYTRSDILNHVHNLERFRNFRFAVFTDTEKRFAAYTPSWALNALLTEPGRGDDFVRAITENRIDDLRRFPAVISQATSRRSSNHDALCEMRRLNLEALVVTEDDGRVAGVVERDQVIATIILSLMDSVKAANRS